MMFLMLRRKNEKEKENSSIHHMGGFQLARKKVGFKRVDFFAGISTPNPDDDKRVSFIARNRGKKSPLPPPSEAGIKIPKEVSRGIETGLLEKGGFQFDNAFGLGKKRTFETKIGLNLNLGKGAFNTKFSNEFIRANFEDQPSAIDPVEDNEFLTGLGGMENQFDDEFTSKAPKLLDTLPKVNQGKKIPLTDEKKRRKKLTKRKRELIDDTGFENVRAKQLSAGDAPLTPEEQLNFSRRQGFRGQEF